MDINLGRIRPVVKGQWLNSTTYVDLDIVTDSGSAYICKVASTTAALTDTTAWEKLVAQGPIGVTGASGTNGATWRSGNGVPSNTLGVDGDFYLQIDTSDVYSKSGGVYSIALNIKGPQGPAGSSGTDLPTLHSLTLGIY